MESTDDPPLSIAAPKRRVQAHANGNVSPTLSKRFSSLSLAAVDTSGEMINGSPRQLSSSPRSPVLNRKASNQSIRPPSWRISSNNISSTGFVSSDQRVVPSIEEQPVMTAASVAEEYFKKELARHDASTSLQTDTVVIMHDACYGHRYSRPKTSKTTLSLIVERPERLQAGALGLSSAYVRLGQRHAGGACPPGIQESETAVPFAIHRTSRVIPLTSPIVAAVHGTKWMQELKTMCEAAEVRLASGGKELMRPETPNGINGAAAAKPHLHEGDLYLAPQSLAALEGALGGVCDGVDSVFSDIGQSSARRKAFVCIRPPGHHCSADLPSGFCWLNNVHVGIEHAIQAHGLTHAAIIDFDLHHGDGSQAIAWERNARTGKPVKGMAKIAQSRRAPIGYFSLHDINSYPCENGELDKIQRASMCIDNAHNQTIWNVHLQPWSTLAEFWELYEKRYMTLLDKTRAFLRLQHQRVRSTPGAGESKGAIFISAGFDASQWEMATMQRHKVNVPTDFYARFTSDIVKLAQEEGTGVDGRVISVLEGGYSDRAITSGVMSHIAGLTRTSTLSDEGLMMPSGPLQDEHQTTSWNGEWWNDSTLRELEILKTPPLPPASLPVKKVRANETPTYQSPTQSFTAKVVDPTKMYRSVSGSIAQLPISRPASPPPLPDVDWATAAYELSKLLIPSNRQVDSYRHEELNEPKVKRERHSSIGLLASDPSRETRQLRAKKEPDSAAEQKQERSNRRRTTSVLPEPLAQDTAAGSMPAPVPAPAEPARPPAKVRPTASLRADSSKTKARRASSTKDDLAKQISMAAPPVPRMPSGASSRPESVGSKASSGKTEAPLDVAGRDTDIETLSSGVKKITLKLSHDSQKEQPAVAKKPTARKPAAPRVPKATPTNPPVKKTTKAKQTASGTSQAVNPEKEQQVGDVYGNASATTGTDQVQESTEGPVAAGAPTLGLDGASDPTPQANIAAQTIEPIRPSPMPDQCVNGESIAQPVQSPTLTQQDVNSSTENYNSSALGRPELDGTNDFVPYSPPGQPMHSAPSAANMGSSTTHDLTWLPPNTNTPVHAAGKKGKENLPNFSATGAIPFALGEKGSALQQNTSAISDRPPQSAGRATGDNLTNVDTTIPAALSAVREDTTFANDEQQKETQHSVWDVPETPQRPA